MNALLEKLNNTETEQDFYTEVNKIRQAAETNPVEMSPVIEAAYREAQALSKAAGDAYMICNAKLAENPTVEAKAAAWDAYWEREGARGLENTVYEEWANVGYIMGIVEHEGIEAWKKIKAETDAFNERLKNPVTVGVDEFPF